MADPASETLPEENSSENGLGENTNGTATDVDPNAEPSALEKKIIRQIEYYFGDYNLPKDKFLQEQMKADDGWIPFETMFKFKRLADLTTDKDVVVAALEKSEKQLVRVDESRSKIRRAPEYPIPEYNEERRKELMLRTAYVKGFPADKKMNDVLAFFESEGAPVESVYMRFYCDKAKKQFVFKGSVFATFKTVEDCDRFVRSGPHKYDDGPDLLIKWQADYIDGKKKERAEMKEAQYKSRQAAKNVEAAEEKETELPECSILHMKGFATTTSRETIRSKLEEANVGVAFIEFNKGEAEGYVRLQGESAAADYAKTLSDDDGRGKVEIDGAEIDVRALEGDELAAHLEKIKGDMKKHKKFLTNKKKQKGKGGKGGGGRHGRKRRAEAAVDGPPAPKKN